MHQHSVISLSSAMWIGMDPRFLQVDNEHRSDCAHMLSCRFSHAKADVSLKRARILKKGSDDMYRGLNQSV